MVALFPGHRYLDGHLDPGGVARLPPVRVGTGADGVSRAGARRALERGNASSWSDYAYREWVGAAAAGGNGLALSTSAKRRHGLDAAAAGATRTCDGDRGQGPAAFVSALSEVGRGTQAGPQDRGRGRARARRL